MRRSKSKILIYSFVVILFVVVSTFLIVLTSSNSKNISVQKSKAASDSFLSDSKLGVWREGDHRGDQPTLDLINAGPKVFKVNGFVNQMKFLKNYKDIYPTGTTVVRILNESGKYNGEGRFKPTDNPKTSADLFFNDVIKPALNNNQRIPSDFLKYVDYIEAPNEFDSTPGWDMGVAGANSSTIVKDWISPFWVQLIDDVATSGVKLCIASLPAGNPQTNGSNVNSKIDDFEPALKEARLKGDAFCYHSYIAINKDTSDACNSNYVLSESNQKQWALLYRDLHAEMISLGISKGEDLNLPFILSETGIDTVGLTGGGSVQAIDGGWLSKGSLCGNDVAYETMLKWLDNRMIEDTYVIGSTLFQTGDPGWVSHEIDPSSDEKADGGSFPYAGNIYQGHNIHTILPWLIKHLKPSSTLGFPTPTSAPTQFMPSNPPPTNAPTPTNVQGQKKIKVYSVCSDNNTGMFVPFNLDVLGNVRNLKTPYNSETLDNNKEFTLTANDISGVVFKGIYHYDNLSIQITSGHVFKDIVGNLTDAFALEYSGCSAPVATQAPTPTTQLASCSDLIVSKGLSSPPSQQDTVYITSSITSGVMPVYDWFYKIDSGNWQNYSLYSGEPHDSTTSTTSFSSLAGVPVGSTVYYSIGNPSGTNINSGPFTCLLSIKIPSATTPTPGISKTPTPTTSTTGTPVVSPTSTTTITPSIAITTTPSPVALTPSPTGILISPTIMPSQTATNVPSQIYITPTSSTVINSICQNLQTSIYINTYNCTNVVLLSKGFGLNGNTTPNSNITLNVNNNISYINASFDGSWNWTPSNDQTFLAVNSLSVTYIDPSSKLQNISRILFKFNSLPSTGFLNTQNILIGTGIVFIGISVLMFKYYAVESKTFIRRIKKVIR